ncbi:MULTISPECIES: transposase [Acetobacter]|uniref:transposase n=1 Tax=Acetobacter TaxID=434 RepID=UPI0012FD2C3D
MLDNLGSHKGDAARKAIRAAGARMIFMPPYSPDLNPITECSRNPGSTGAWILSRMP